MVDGSYIPDACDLIWIDFTPQAGHRPAMVLSPNAYNGKIGLLVCCPLTSQIKNYPFEVPISDSIPNVTLCDQLKSVDWRSRNAKYKSKITADKLAEIRERIAPLLGL